LVAVSIGIAGLDSVACFPGLFRTIGKGLIGLGIALGGYSLGRFAESKQTRRAGMRYSTAWLIRSLASQVLRIGWIDWLGMARTSHGVQRQPRIALR
jgi:hypothetical protein